MKLGNAIQDHRTVLARSFKLAAAALLLGGTARAGSLTVTNAAAMNGTTKGLEATITNTDPLYVEDDTPNGESHYHGRFYFNPVNFDPGESQAHFRTRIFLGFTENQNPAQRVFAIVLKRQGGIYQILGRCRQDDLSQHDTNFITITAAAHLIEFDWTRSTGAGANNGTFQMWIDGVQQGNLGGNDNDAIGGVDYVRMGALSVKGGAAGTMYWDEFASTR